MLFCISSVLKGEANIRANLVTLFTAVINENKQTNHQKKTPKPQTNKHPHTNQNTKQTNKKSITNMKRNFIY